MSNIWARFFWRPSRFPGEVARPGLVAETRGAQTRHSGRKQPLDRRVACLEILGVEDQLQLARLIFLVFAALIL
jgi:hypothetical protein